MASSASGGGAVTRASSSSSTPSADPFSVIKTKDEGSGTSCTLGSGPWRTASCARPKAVFGGRRRQRWPRAILASTTSTSTSTSTARAMRRLLAARPLPASFPQDHPQSAAARPPGAPSQPPPTPAAAAVVAAAAAAVRRVEARVVEMMGRPAQPQGRRHQQQHLHRRRKASHTGVWASSLRVSKRAWKRPTWTTP